MFRFTIRDVLWLTVVVALGLAWVLERRRSTGLEQQVRAVENDAQLSRVAIKSLYEDLERIERELAPHDLTVVWSKDLRPTIQTMQPMAAGLEKPIDR